ncbi:MAG: nitrate reductase gamma subunit [Ignavibacteria bacterium]|nr:nitrate reductase gamma subunit [Ignavibacteria bacterium]
MNILNIAIYFSVLLFLITVFSKIIKIIKAPLHLRWELYPVPHEKGKAHYGGSRLEEVDWWTKPMQHDVLGDWKIMLPEIIFLKAVWEHNKSLWWGTFPFHFALYMLFTNVVLCIIAALMNLGGNTVLNQTGGFDTLMYWLIQYIVWVGSALGVLGAVKLFSSRLFVPGLRKFSAASHYFNIILIGGIYLTAFIWSVTDISFMNNLIGIYTGLITLNSIPELPFIAYLDVWLIVLFLAYLPFTHMTHFFVKYFTYHKIRWEDSPNVSGSKMQAEISSLLNQPVSWSAPHIGADGRKTWVAIASAAPEKIKK